MELPPDLSVLETVLLFDPQTTGGMLITVADTAAASLQRRLDDAGTASWHVAQVVTGNSVRVIR